jgi:hypothetical protein
MGGWAYKGSVLVVKVPVHVGNESPEVVDAADVVEVALRRIGKMVLERRTRSLLEGCPLMGKKSAWAAARAELIALGVMVAGWEIWGGLPVLRTRNIC